MGSCKATNYWVWKDSELMADADRRGIKYESKPFRRKILIDLLNKDDLENGRVKHVQTEQEQGKLTGLEVLPKDEKGQLIVSKVVFHNTGEHDMPYIFVGHNGTGFYIPKEMEVEVPDYILDSCIKDAVEDRMFPVTGPDGSINWRTKRVQRFPYSIIEKSYPADIKR